jgi:hypothetical protein
VGGNPISRIDPTGLIGTFVNPNIGPFGIPRFGSGPCPTPPLAPPGVNVNDNINIAQDYSWLNPGSDIAFYQNVRNYGPWDYKRKGSQYEDFGNFNFGATAAAMGWPYYIGQNGAGIYQQLAGAAAAGQGTPFLSWPYGDDPADAKQIQAGYNYYNNHCGCGQ